MHRLAPVDVVVVGAGMGGAAFCARLAEKAPGLRIACLERGGWADPAAMPPLRSDWQRATLNDWATSPNMRLRSAFALRRLRDR
jgi:choline dehydrogenase-like flavoprotein